MQEISAKVHAQSQHPESAASADLSALKAILLDRRDMYETLARRAGFSIDFSGDTTCFDHNTDTVIISLEQLHSLGIHTIAELDFIVLHELGHLKEYCEDPQGYLKIIEDCKAKGELKHTYYRLHNWLADIYVNTNSANVAPQYSSEEGFSNQVKELYRLKAFSKRDFTTRPLSSQFRDYLLNLGMGVADDITLSPEVSAAINAGTKLFGKAHSFEEVVKTYFVPAIGRRRTDEWRATASERYFITNQAILPIFEALLKKDIEAGRDLTDNANALETVELDLNGAEAAIKKIVRAAKEANLTPKERAEREQARQAATLGKEAGLSDVMAQDFAARLNRLQPEINQIVGNLKQLQSPQTTWNLVREGHFREGDDLDIPHTIENFGKILDLPREARVMLQSRYAERQELTPRKVRMWLVLDLSGSMEGDLEHLKDLTVCLTAAMATLSLETELAEGSLQGELAVVGFSDEQEVIIAPKPGITLADAALAFSKIKAAGDTYEYKALSEVLNRYRTIKLTEQEQGIHCVDLLISITDGETNNPDLSVSALDELSAEGLTIQKGIKIMRSSNTITLPADPEHDDKEKPSQVGDSAPSHSEYRGSTFDQIWNRTAERRSGSYVQFAKSLPYVIRQMIEEHADAGRKQR